MVFWTQTSPIYFSDFLMSQYFIGIACFTFGTAFVQALVAELPFVRLEKILLGGSRRPQKAKTEQLNGGVNATPTIATSEKVPEVKNVQVEEKISPKQQEIIENEKELETVETKLS